MKTATIEYEDDRVLEAIRALGTALDFRVVSENGDFYYLSGIPIKRGKGLTMEDITEMQDLYDMATADPEKARLEA